MLSHLLLEYRSSYGRQGTKLSTHREQWTLGNVGGKRTIYDLLTEIGTLLEVFALVRRESLYLEWIQIRLSIRKS